MIPAVLKKYVGQGAMAALIAALLFFHLVGLRTVDGQAGLLVQADWFGLALTVVGVFIGRMVCAAFFDWQDRKKITNHCHVTRITPAPAGLMLSQSRITLILLVLALLLPFFASRYVLDVSSLILTYMLLAYGLNVVVGWTGLLDLGFAVFYALGAYTFSLLAVHAGFSFWQALPLAALVAGSIAALVGAIVLRLRGDYFAVVTLGLAEIVRITLLNWVSLTGGPNGMTGIPRPSFFGFEFQGMERVIFLYYLILVLVVAVYMLLARLRHLPLGRAFEAVREDELAALAVGMNVPRIKLAAYVIAACCGALAGAFFATKQGFISPESFTFSESALVLAITVLGGMGHPLGIALAALFLVGIPEIFRDLQDYRLIAFGAALVLIMIVRPAGLFAKRTPAVKIEIRG